MVNRHAVYGYALMRSVGDVDTIYKMLGYSNDVVELTGNRVRLQLTVNDRKLANADEITRNGGICDSRLALNNRLHRNPELSQLQAISVGIFHSTAAGATPTDWQIEGLIEYRRGPSNRFAVRIT